MKDREAVTSEASNSLEERRRRKVVGPQESTARVASAAEAEELAGRS